MPDIKGLQRVLYNAFFKHADREDAQQTDAEIPAGLGGLGGLRYSHIDEALDRASKRKMQRMLLNLYKGPQDEAARLATYDMGKEVQERFDKDAPKTQADKNIVGETAGKWTGAVAGAGLGAMAGISYRDEFPERLRPAAAAIGMTAGVAAPIFAASFLAQFRKRNVAQQVEHDQSSHVLSDVLVPGKAVYNDIQRVRAGQDVLKGLSRY